MSTYNLIKNSIFRSTTSSGTGTKTLSQTELFSLVDGITTASEVVLSTEDTLYLDVDFHQRINVNGIFIYADDLTKLSHIDFYYKNSVEDDFYSCIKGISNAYTATIPSPSAPRYIRCVISEVNLSLFEFTIFNDDTKVKFGTSGTADTTWLTDTPVGEYGTSQAVEVYNSSNIPITAYACVDFIGENDDYIKISDKIDGDYIGFDEGVVVGYNYASWTQGTFVNTQADVTGNLVLVNKGSNNVILATRLCSLPINTCNYRATPFGVHKGWAYDHVNEVIWATFYTGSTDTNGVIKLYKYVVATNIWIYTCDIYHTDISSWNFTFTCDATYLYFHFSSNEDYVYVYKHDPLGPVGNLTGIGTRNIGSYGGERKYITTDYNGNLYLIIPYSTNNNVVYFFRFHANGTPPTELSRPPHYWIDTYEMSLHYSAYDGNIYFLGSNTSERYMQKYHVATGTWSSAYFNYGAAISTTNTWLKMCIYDKYIYFYEPSYLTKIYRYDLSTAVLEEKNIGMSFRPGYLPYMIVTAPLQSDDDFSAFLLSIGGSDVFYLYGYNTGYEHTNTIENIVEGIGTYATPIIYLDDPYQSSYIKVSCTSKAGVTSVSKDLNLHNGTVEMRTSHAPLTPIDEIYWNMAPTGGQINIYRYTVGTGIWENFLANSFSVYTRSPEDIAVCRRTGKIAIFWQYTHYTDYYHLAIYNREKTLIKTPESGNRSFRGAYFDASSSLWWYDELYKKLRRVPRNDVDTNYDMASAPYALAAELNGTDCWFVDRASYTLSRISPGGTLRLALNLHNPFGVCSTEDSCVWVVQQNEPTYGNCVQKYDRSGNLLNTIKSPEAFVRITHDHYGGFYARGVNDIGNFYRYDAQGKLLLTITGHPGYDYMKSGQRGFVTYNPTARRSKYFSGDTGEVTWTLSQMELGFDITYSQCCPDIFSWDEESQRLYSTQYKKLLPVVYDPIWYGDTTLPWVEIPKDGYFLPNNIRHQFKITLRNFDGISTPTVHNITMAPAIEIKDIPPKESKPMYVKSDIPYDTPFIQFDLKLKVWWKEEEN